MKSNPKHIKRLCQVYRNQTANTLAREILEDLKKGVSVERKRIMANIRTWMNNIEIRHNHDYVGGVQLDREDAEELADNLIASFASGKK